MHPKERLKQLLSRIRSYFTKKLSYIVGFFIIVLVPLFVLSLGFNGSAGSARYLLSALSQSLAAIVALSFTLPLIVLQTVASRYGTKVYDLYFDKWTLSFMLFSVFSTVFPFFVLTRIDEPDSGFLTQTHSNYVTVALSLAVLTLFFLIVFIWNLKGKLKPENIIMAYVQEIENFVSNHELSRAYEKVNILKGVGIDAARKRDDITFGVFLSAWFDLIMLDDAAWILNVLENSLPDIFKTIAAEDETIAINGLNKLEVISLKLAETKEITKSKRVVELIPNIIGPLIKSNPDVARASLYILRNIGQICTSISKSDEAQDISIATIEALERIGQIAAFTEPQISKEAIWEISNITHKHLLKKIIAEKGIEAIASFKGFVIGERYPVVSGEFPDEIKKKANDTLLHFLDSVSVKRDEKFSLEDRISIADKKFSYVDVSDSKDAAVLIIVASRFMKEDEKSSKRILDLIVTELEEEENTLPEGITKAKSQVKEFHWDIPIEGFVKKYLRIKEHKID